MKLAQTMFYDPEPDEDSLGYDIESHVAWERRQVEPEEPQGEFRGNYKNNDMFAWELRREAWPEHYKAWSDYFEKLAYYESRRLRWEGFELSAPFSGLDKEFVFKQNRDDLENLYVLFYGNGVFEIGSGGTFSVTMEEPPSVELFELFCKENGIELIDKK